MSSFWKIFITVIITAAVIGGGGYYLMHKKSVDDKAKLQTQIDDLNKQISDLKKTSTDETVSWKTYTKTASSYGFSFKYPDNWVSYSLSADEVDGATFTVAFKNPAVIPTSDDPYVIQNIYVRVTGKADSDNSSLSSWLANHYRSKGGELEDYQVGDQITLGGISGYVSDIGCCGGMDKSYVAQKVGEIFFIGTNSTEKYSKLAQIASTFKFANY